MYDLPLEQWQELGWRRRAIAGMVRVVPGIARLKVFGLPSGLISVTDGSASIACVDVQGKEGLYRVPQGWIWSRGAHLDRDGKVIKEISPGVNRPPAWWLVRRQKFFPAVRRCPGTIFSMIGDDADNLYHWTFDVLPRLRLLDPAGRGKVRVLARLKHSFHRASLEAAGFAPDSILPAEPMTFYETDELLAASIVKGVTADNLSNARAIYLKAAASVQGAGPRLRLYISRAGATSRRVVNEADLLRMLEPHGFRSVAMEKLPWAEQLALFRDAEMIISPTGAALAHLHLCGTATRLLILMPLGCADFLYRDMARTVGLDVRLLDVPLAAGADPDPVKSDVVLDAPCFDAIRSFVD